MLKRFNISSNSIVALALSLFFTASGVCLLVIANVGSDAVTMFCSGLSRYFDISLGAASNFTNIGVLVAALLVGKKYIGFTTIATCLLMGIVINLLNPIYIGLVAPLTENILISYVIFLFGLLSESFGCAILIHYQTGMNQLDALATGLVDTFNLKYPLVRTLMDVCLFLFGFIMGAKIGIGTLICVLTMGTIINCCVKVLNSYHVKQ